MKKLYFLHFLFFFALSITLFSQDNTPSKGKSTLLLMNPTVNHISGITWLIENGIFPVKDLNLKGVYYAKESYDYSESEQYIKDNDLAIKLERIDEYLQPDKLFCKNSCSEAFEKLFNESSGVIFFGGPDIPPAIYFEKTSILTAITEPYRHYFEASFLFHLLGGLQDMNFIPLLEKNSKYLIVGFCLGMQTMNVATGGTMIQDIPLEVYKKKNVEDILSLPKDKQHRNYANDIQDSTDLFWGNIHPIKFITGSWPEKEGLAKQSQYPVVISSHHQAVEKTGRDIQIVATSMDNKIIEAVDHQKYPNVFGFQFHPEVTDIYNYKNSYQCNPESEKESLRLIIEKGNGYEFHLSLWRKFAEVLNTGKK